MALKFCSVIACCVVCISLSGAAFSPLQAQTKSIVYGWHPYWIEDTAVNNYNPTLLTHLAWFSAEVDTSTGGFLTTHNFSNSAVCNWALANGVKLHLTVTLFGNANNAAILSSPTKQDVLIQSIITAVTARNAHGVCLDFEDVGQPQRTQLLSFVRTLKNRLVAANPEFELVMASPPVDWNNSWDLQALATECTALILMGYDYYWNGSPTAGPVAPLRGETYSLSTSVNTYLATGVPSSKLVLALPWYGRTWPVLSVVRKAPSSGNATEYRYSSIMQMQGADARVYDASTNSVWFNTNDGQTLQTWFDDSASLDAKYNYVLQEQLAGIGIWALGYEGNGGELWRGIGVYVHNSATSVSSPLPAYPPRCVELIVQNESGIVVHANCAATLKAFTLDGRLVYQNRMPAGVSMHTPAVRFPLLLVVGEAETYLLP